MTRLQKIETAVYALLWSFAVHLTYKHLTRPEPAPERPAASTKLTAKQVMMGERRAANR